MVSVAPLNHASTIVSYAPMGVRPVGQENTDLRVSTVKAVEQTAASAAGENRRVPKRSTGDAKDENAQADHKAAQQEQLLKDQAKISMLSARDRDVRAHEQAHAAVGGQYASAPTYEFVKGPDGVNYAVSGEVSISMGSVPNDPESTILKAQQVQAAANAPADPSDQDRSVAAAAASLEAQARAELSAKKNSDTQKEEALSEKQFEQKINVKKAEESQINSKEQRGNEVTQFSFKDEASVHRAIGHLGDTAGMREKTLDISKHLVDIGAVNGVQSTGRFLNQRV